MSTKRLEKGKKVMKSVILEGLQNGCLDNVIDMILNLVARYNEHNDQIEYYWTAIEMYKLLSFCHYQFIWYREYADYSGSISFKKQFQAVKDWLYYDHHEILSERVVGIGYTSPRSSKWNMFWKKFKSN